jgi:hypothetical protein
MPNEQNLAPLNLDPEIFPLEHFFTESLSSSFGQCCRFR